MISDEPDEDADTLDDDDVMDTLIGLNPRDRDPSKAGTVSRDAASVQDWPPLNSNEYDYNLNVATLAWFKTNHVDWRRAIASVLNAWVEAITQAETAAQP